MQATCLRAQAAATGRQSVAFDVANESRHLRASLLPGIFTSAAATIEQESNDYSSTRQPK